MFLCCMLCDIGFRLCAFFGFTMIVIIEQTGFALSKLWETGAPWPGISGYPKKGFIEN